MICNKTECGQEAKFQLGFRVWAEEYPKTSTPIVTYLGIAVCECCKESVDINDFLTPENNASINNVMVKNGNVPLDFSTAELVFHDIIDGKLNSGQQTIR